MATAPVLAFSRPASKPLIPVFPSAERRDEIRYPGGHVVLVRREHLENVLRVKAALVEVEAGKMVMEAAA